MTDSQKKDWEKAWNSTHNTVDRLIGDGKRKTEIPCFMAGIMTLEVLRDWHANPGQGLPEDLREEHRKMEEFLDSTTKEMRAIIRAENPEVADILDLPLDQLMGTPPDQDNSALRRIIRDTPAAFASLYTPEGEIGGPLSEFLVAVAQAKSLLEGFRDLRDASPDPEERELFREAVRLQEEGYEGMKAALKKVGCTVFSPKDGDPIPSTEGGGFIVGVGTGRDGGTRIVTGDQIRAVFAGNPENN